MTTQTHETFIMAVAQAAIARLPDEERKVFSGMKLTYGMGLPGVRALPIMGVGKQATPRKRQAARLSRLAQAVKKVGCKLPELQSMSLRTS